MEIIEENNKKPQGRPKGTLKDNNAWTKEKQKEYMKEYREKNKDKVSNINKEYKSEKLILKKIESNEKYRKVFMEKIKKYIDLEI